MNASGRRVLQEVCKGAEGMVKAVWRAFSLIILGGLGFPAGPG